MATAAYSRYDRRPTSKQNQMKERRNDYDHKRADQNFNNQSSANNRSNFIKRPNAEWEYRSFSSISLETDSAATDAENMIAERRLVASYNWDVDSWIPTIVVPGAPKVFQPWMGGLLETRNQAMTIDEESFRIPNSPMEPLFTAVRLCQPNFKLSDVDLVADLNCLKKLLRFVLRAAFPVDDAEAEQVNVDRNVFAGSFRECEFRIDGQVIGNTIVLMRRETEHRGRAMGFGVAYLEACTQRYDADECAAGPHKRVTFVQFGGLRLLLRHKVLAAIYPDEEEKAKSGPETAMGSGGDGGSWPSSMDCSTVRFVKGGYLGDHNSLMQMELASISKDRTSPMVIDKWLDMLFIGSDHLYLGEHTRGRFDQMTMRTRADALELSGLKPDDGHRLLVILESLLKKIVDFGRKSGAVGTRRGKGPINGAGDGYHQQSTREPHFFTIVSRDGCRKLSVYKNGQAKSRNGPSNGYGGKQSDSAPSCVSEGMLAALLADSDDVASG